MLIYSTDERRGGPYRNGAGADRTWCCWRPPDEGGGLSLDANERERFLLKLDGKVVGGNCSNCDSFLLALLLPPF
jgi:hypothetical protein